MSEAPWLQQGRVLVTGSTGFLGQHLLADLAARGVRPIGAARTIPLEEARVDGAEYRVVGDIGPGTDWSEVLEGVVAVIHTAARVHVMRGADELEFRRVNELGTARLAQQAAECGVRRLVFVSSIKVNGETTSTRPFRSDDIPNPADAYARSKLAAEAALWRESATSGLEIAVVRPPLVYGPGVGANFRSLMNWVRAGIPLPFGGLQNKRSLVSVWTLVALLRQLLADARAPGRVWLASDGCDLSTPDIVRLLASPMQQKLRMLSVPIPVLKVLGTLSGRGAQVRRMVESLQVDSEPAVEELEFRRPKDVREAFELTVAAYLRERSGHAA